MAPERRLFSFNIRITFMDRKGLLIAQIQASGRDEVVADYIVITQK
jgi:hypothetical protein